MRYRRRIVGWLGRKLGVLAIGWTGPEEVEEEEEAGELGYWEWE